MAGKALATFQDWVKATNERVLTPPKDIISDAVNRTYALADALRGRGEDEVVQSGASITDRLQLVSGSQFSFYDPNEQFTPVIEDTLTKIQCPWRFAKDLWAWTDHEIKLNGGDRLIQWKNLRDSKRQASHVSLYNGVEAAIWATANQNTMESLTATGGRPYSILAFIAENGIQPSGWTTTIQQVDPTANPRWQNQVSNYAAAQVDTTLVSGMENLWRLVKFESPETKEDYFRETKFRKMKVYTNLDGWRMAVRLLRQSNDRNYPTNDLGYATEDPVFGRIPIKWVEALEAQSYASGQPRFFFVNYEYLFPVYHAERYMYETDPINGGHMQPYSWVVYKDVWYNWFCRSRWRQGILVPV